jgi:hypothetical protein
MTKVQLTDTAENIVNQIISSDAIEVSYGPVCGLHVYTDNIDMGDEGITINTKEDDDVGVPFISNEALNMAQIVNGNIEIPLLSVDFHWTAIISLYKLNKVVAIN